MQTKVRDVKYCRETLKLATLGTDGILKLWDPNLTSLQSVTASHGPHHMTPMQCHHVLLNGTHKQQCMHAVADAIFTTTNNHKVEA